MQEGSHREDATPIGLEGSLHYLKEEERVIKAKGWR